MPADVSGVTDAVIAQLNESDPNSDTKGPDPAVWDNPDQHGASTFDEGAGVVKGPDPAQWGSDARHEQGAIYPESDQG